MCDNVTIFVITSNITNNTLMILNIISPNNYSKQLCHPLSLWYGSKRLAYVK